MDVLVTGGAGFVGTNFIDYILEKYSDYNIVCVDKLTFFGNRHNIDELENKYKNFRFCQADICDSEEVLKVFKFWQGFDAVVNFVSESHKQSEIISSNITGTFKLLEIVKKYKVKKFVQISTNEDLNKTNLYSSSKASADLIALSYFKAFKVPVVVSRCSSNFGPYQYPQKLIPLIITNALQGKHTSLHNNSRDLLNVIDHCRGIETLLHYGKSGETYDFGSNIEFSVLDVAQFILEHLNLPFSMIHEDDCNEATNAIDFSKASKEFGWHPMIDFETSLKETIEWYKNNEDWWKPLKIESKL